MSDLYFVLGAPDPEMSQIERVLKLCAVSYQYATSGGARVNSRTAYNADSSRAKMGLYVVAVECDGEALRVDYKCDHHRDGDYGYAKGPERFWEGSSLGQVVSLLEEFGYEVDITYEMKLAAASDHCPSHAYLGLCPGVSASDLMHYRLENRSKRAGVSVEEILRRVDDTVSILKSLEMRKLADGFYVDTTQCDALCELSEASLRCGVAVEYTLTDSADAKVKKGILNASVEMTTKWMDMAEEFLDDVYGNPYRGYAGGYVREEHLNISQEQLSDNESRE